MATQFRDRIATVKARELFTRAIGFLIIGIGVVT